MDSDGDMDILAIGKGSDKISWFEMETYYYWNYEKNQVSTLSLLNKKVISKGIVKKRNGIIENYSTSYYPDGHSDSKLTFEIDTKGILHDRFFRKKSTSWILGHLIKYKITKNTKYPRQ